MNNTENNIDKQKLYELQLIIDQCKYKQQKKVLDDSILVLKNYQDLNPILSAININLLELQGNINVAFSGQIFKIFIILRFFDDYPKTNPFLFLKNIDTKKFFCNPIFKTGEVQNGQFIFINSFLQISKQWKSDTKIIQFIVEAQQLLSRNFPFFSQNQNNQNQSQFIQNPQMQQQSIYQQNQQRISDPSNLWQQSSQLYGQSQYQGIQQQQQQQQIQPIQQQNNPYSVLNQSQMQVQQQNTQIQNNNKQQQQQQQLNNDETITKKLKTFGSSVFELGKELLMTKEQKEEKIINETKEKVNLEILNYNKKIIETIAEQRKCIDQQIYFYQQQQQVQKSQQQVDQQIRENLHNLDNEMVQNELGIESCITMLSQQETNNFEELLQFDQLSNQIIDQMSQIQSIKEGFYFVQKKFIYQDLDYETLIKTTKQLSLNLFECQLQLKKCLVQQL